MKKTSQPNNRHIKNVLLVTAKLRNHFHNNSSRVYKAALVLSVLLLLLTTMYTAFKTSNYFSTNSDALIATHQFSKGVEGNTVALPGSHSNILTIPLLYTQGHLPYRYKSFTIVNMGLMLVTVFAWAYLLIRIFGRRYEILILTLLSSLVFASTTFNIGIGNTTFRNIGFPLALWFILIINRRLQNKKYFRKELVGSVVGCVLFSILLAGDSFFIYSILAPIFLVFLWYWAQSRKFTKGMLEAAALILVVVIASQIIKWLLAALKIIYFDYTFLGKPSVLPVEHLGPSLQVALRQLTELQGASVFGAALEPKNLLLFMNMAVLIIGVIGLVFILMRAGRSFSQKKELVMGSDFILTALALSYFVILAEYIFSGYAVVKFNGEVIDLLNTRYITLLPLITIVGFVWLIKNYYQELRYTLLIGSAVVIGVILYHPGMRAAYALQDQTKPVPSRTSIDNIIGYLTANDVDMVVTDFWYGPPLRFWSSDRISYAPQINCNQPLSFDSREDWYKPVKGKRTALIVDRGGLNYGYWSCSDNDLIKIYGEPVKKAVTPGVKPGEVVNIWIYDYDVRSRIQPFPTLK